MSLEDIRDADFNDPSWPQTIPVHRTKQAWMDAHREPHFPFAEYRERARRSVRELRMSADDLQQPSTLESEKPVEPGSLVAGDSDEDDVSVDGAPFSSVVPPRAVIPPPPDIGDI